MDAFGKVILRGLNSAFWQDSNLRLIAIGLSDSLLYPSRTGSLALPGAHHPSYIRSSYSYREVTSSVLSKIISIGIVVKVLPSSRVSDHVVRRRRFGGWRILGVNHVNVWLNLRVLNNLEWGALSNDGNRAVRRGEPLVA